MKWTKKLKETIEEKALEVYDLTKAQQQHEEVKREAPKGKRLTQNRIKWKAKNH
ncbi:hypothetical protein [Enterococcus bulliens]|uniref:hypothetical protein n=1 Tax=uncultured Enterococcus sp. TaxID=167972 RepID=UPI0025E9F9C7|nr:hypothetical protein [uncultured Enterococcus sp.]